MNAPSLAARCQRAGVARRPVVALPQQQQRPVVVRCPSATPSAIRGRCAPSAAVSNKSESRLFFASPAPARATVVVASAASAVGAAASSSSSPEDDKSSSSKSLGFVGDRLADLKALATPFSDPVSNGRLVALCLAQMLCSVATLIHDTYLPVYLQDVLGLSNSKIGNLQAIAQFLCNASKSLSGTLADVLSPARMVIFGTLLTTLNKPMFAASGWIYASFGTVATLYWITAGKVFDRMSKGIREAPGKALIGDLAATSGDSPEGAFGLRQALATTGALLGSAIAGLAYKLSGQNYVLTFALAAAPAAAALVLTVGAFGPMAAESAAAKKKKKADADEAAAVAALSGGGGGKAKKAGSDDALAGKSLADKARALRSALTPAYWQALVVVSLLYFARFDASFITLRAKQVLPKTQLPLLTSLMMVVQAALAAPAGLRAKKSLRDRNKVLLAGYAAMVAADLTFAFAPAAAGMFAGAALVGVHMALTHGVTLAMIASYIPTGEVPGLGKISGTCWSFTDLVFGVILAYSNSVAGRLSDLTIRAELGNIGCFLGGSAATILSGLALVLFSTFSDLGKEEAVVVKRGGR